MFNEKRLATFQSIRFPDSWKVKNRSGTTYDLTDHSVYGQVKRVAEYLHDLIDNHSGEFDINMHLQTVVTQLLRQYESRGNQLDQIKNADDNDAVNVKHQLMNSVNDIMSRVFSRTDQDYNLLTLYDSIRINAMWEDTGQRRADQLIQDLTQELENVQTLRASVEKHAVQNEISKFSTIFHRESDKFSSFHIRRFWQLGRAQIYFTFGVIGSIGLIYYLITTDLSALLLQVNGNLQIAESLFNSIHHLLMLSLRVYLISFCFKQYYIAEHLSVQNKHRANSLDSFEGFLLAIKDKHEDIRATLVLEVAKSIYGQGNTGYLQKGNDAIVSPGIIEVTKMISTNKS